MIKINISTLEYILKITPSEQNIMLVGRHGIGKSKILESYFTRQGLKVVTLFLGHRRKNQFFFDFFYIFY